RAEEATQSAHRTVWMTTLLLAAVTAAAIVVFLIVIQRGVSRPLTAVVGVLGDLARGNTAVVVSGSTRRDEIGALVGAVQIFKDKMTESAGRRGEREQLKARAEAEKRSALVRIAHDFEVIVGNIV